jgi:hypothetical protein
MVEIRSGEVVIVCSYCRTAGPPTGLNISDQRRRGISKHKMLGHKSRGDIVVLLITPRPSVTSDYHHPYPSSIYIYSEPTGRVFMVHHGTAPRQAVFTSF